MLINLPISTKKDRAVRKTGLKEDKPQSKSVRGGITHAKDTQ